MTKFKLLLITVRSIVCELPVIQSLRSLRSFRSFRKYTHINIVETIISPPSYKGVVFESYCGTAVPLEVLRYCGMTRKVHPYIKDEILWLLLYLWVYMGVVAHLEPGCTCIVLYIWVYFWGHTAVPRYFGGTAVPQYDPKSRPIYIAKAIICNPIYMGLLLGSYCSTAILWWYCGTAV